MSSVATDGWHVGLLGGWMLRRNAVPVPVPRRPRRLITAIALRGPRSRPYLAQLLWPDVSTRRATNNLRNTLWHTTHELPGLLADSAEVVDLHPGVVVDVHEAHRAAANVMLTRGLTGVDALVEQEPLLPDWYEDWVLDERESLHRLRVECLETLTRRALDSGAVGNPGQAAASRVAVRTAIAACAAEPLSESLALLLIQAHVAAGDVAVGLKSFETFRSRLNTELFVQPSGSLDSYVEGITRTLRTPSARLQQGGG